MKTTTRLVGPAALGGQIASMQLARCRIAVLITTLLCWIGAAQFAAATTRTVTTLMDETDPNDNLLSLREAILASEPGATINFAVAGTITLASELQIVRNLTITGPSANILAVSGHNASRVFNISGGITVNISGLTISDGSVLGANGADGSSGSPNGARGGDAYGGGILNEGTLNLLNCTLSENRATGGAGGSWYSAAGSPGDGGGAMGGGIYNNGTLYLANCTLSRSAASGGSGGFDRPAYAHGGGGGYGAGGAIYNNAMLSLVNCTFTGNSAVGAGGDTAINGDGVGGNGGGASGGGLVSSAYGTLSLECCTLSANSAAGGRGGEDTSSSPSGRGGNGGNGEGGGLRHFSLDGTSATIHNTIIAGNTATGGAGGGSYDGVPGGAGVASGPEVSVSSSITSQGHNLIGRTDGSSGWIGSDLLGGTSDQTKLDPLLGPLHDNGGPTFTMILQPSSAALDAGDDAVLGAPSHLVTDQRGRPRRHGAHVDIGAVEVGPAILTAHSLFDSGPGSLRQLILNASSVESDIIDFDPSLTGMITLSSGELIVDKSLSIIGPGANLLTVSGLNASRVFHVTNGPVLLANLRIADGYAPGGGGGVAVEGGGCVTVSNCTITGCYAAGTDAYGTGGGAISAFGSVCLTVIGSTLSSNSTPIDGGGIYLLNGPTVSVINSTISGNRTLNGSGDGWGGGIFQINGGTLTVTACTIANNSSVSQGGGLYKGLGGSATIANSLIAGNSAPGGPDCKGTFVSSGYNLIGNSSFSTGFGQVGDQLNVNPLIGPLADNGGPTFTHALLTGSPAIDKGKSFDLTTDQRGRQRPYDFASIANVTNGFGADIGAYEVNPPMLSIAKSGSDVLLSWYTSDTGYTLEAKTNLSPAILWTTVPGTPATVGSQYVVTNGPATGNKLYRLIK